MSTVTTRKREFPIVSLRGNRSDPLGIPTNPLTHFDYVMDRAPRFGLGYLYRGQAKLRMGRPAQALQDFRAAIAVDNGLAEARRWAGLALEDLRRPEEALQEAEAALVTVPDYLEAKDLRARLRALLDKRWRWPARRARGRSRGWDGNGQSFPSSPRQDP